VRAGQLRRRLLIETPITTQDDYGAAITTWVPFLTDEPCSIAPGRGREFLAAAAVQAEITTEIGMRFHSGILPTMRGTDEDGVIYQFHAVLPDATGRRSLRLFVSLLPVDAAQGEVIIDGGGS
jgi:SPP1 family predicted phage head-tail adaptor